MSDKIQVTLDEVMVGAEGFPALPPPPPPPPPVVCALTTPQANEARRLYTQERMSLPEIATRLNLNIEELVDRAISARWPQKRSAQASMALIAAEAELHELQAKKLVPTATRHLSVAEIVEEKLHRAADAVDPIAGGSRAISMLGGIARALSFISAVSSKASGLDATLVASKEEAEKSKKQPLVMIGLQVHVSGSEEKRAETDPSDSAARIPRRSSATVTLEPGTGFQETP